MGSLSFWQGAKFLLKLYLFPCTSFVSGLDPTCKVTQVHHYSHHDHAYDDDDEDFDEDDEDDEDEFWIDEVWKVKEIPNQISSRKLKNASIFWGHFTHFYSVSLVKSNKVKNR